MASNPSILVAEDERLFQEFLALSLKSEGYEITCFDTGVGVLAEFDPKKYDLVLLDLQLPDESGIAIARQIRARSDVSIIILTSALDENTRINCLSLYIDDFLVKSVSPEELRLRIRNTLWRAGRSVSAAKRTQSTLAVRNWTIDLDAMIVCNQTGKDLGFTSYEFKTFVLLAQANGRVLSRDQILDGLSRGDDGPSDRMVDAFVSRIRRKLGAKDIITTMKGDGYRLSL